MKKTLEILLYITIFCALLGPNLIGINIPMIGSLTPYRFISIILTVLLIYYFIKTNKKIKLTSNVYIIMIIFFVFILQNLIMIIINENPYEAIAKIINLLFSILIIFLIYNISTNDRISENIIKTIYIFYIVAVITSLYEIYTGNYFFEVAGLSVRKNSLNLYHPIGMFYNTNGMACFLSIMFPLIYDKRIFKKDWLNFIVSNVLLVVSIFICLAADCRLALIYFVMFIIYNIFFKLLKDKKKVKAKKFFSIIGIFCVMIFCFTHFYGQIEILREQILSVNNKEDASINIRSNLIIDGLDMVAKSGFMGIGTGNFETKILNYDNVGNIRNAHNFIIEIFTENGIIIFTLCAILYIKIILNIYHKVKNETNTINKRFMLNLLFTVITFPIYSSINSSSYAYMPLWIIIAIWIIFAYKKEKE